MASLSDINRQIIMINALEHDQDFVQRINQRLKTIFEEKADTNTIHYHPLEPSPPLLRQSKNRVVEFLHQLNHKLEQTAQNWKQNSSDEGKDHWHVFFDMEPVQLVAKKIALQLKVGLLGAGEGAAALCQVNEVEKRVRSIRKVGHEFNLAFWSKGSKHHDLERLLIQECLFDEVRTQIMCEPEIDNVDYVCGKILEEIFHLMDPDKDCKYIKCQGKLEPFDHPIIKMRWVNLL